MKTCKHAENAETEHDLATWIRRLEHAVKMLLRALNLDQRASQRRHKENLVRAKRQWEADAQRETHWEPSVVGKIATLLGLDHAELRFKTQNARLKRRNSRNRTSE